MKAILAVTAALAVLLAPARAHALSATPGEIAAAQGWAVNIRNNPGAASPISFLHGGETSPATSGKWKASETEESPNGFRIVLKCDEKPLELRIEGKTFADSPVVEWVAYLRNTGTSDTPILEDIQSLDMSIPVSGGDPTLHYAKGATCSIEDFRPMSRILNKGGRTHLQPNGGRSSSDFMPFFNLALPDGKGMVFGIGWSGEWAADFARAKDGSCVQVRCGMAQTHLALHPGEEIRTPGMAVLFYEGGSWQIGQNLLRTHILAHHRPAPSGKPLEPLSLNGNWGGTSAADHLENIQAIVSHDLPLEYYWIDAEWFGTGKWHQTAGDWKQKADLYPEGFKPLSDALHASGRKLLLWFEPERVCEGTAWYEEHKDWLLDCPKERRRYNWGTSQAEPDWVEWESSRNQIRENDRLFNLGNPDARVFLTDYMSSKITEFGLDCFRHDANIAPLEFLRAADAPDRQGMAEIRWVEGLYAFWDGLLERHPGLIIDNCASGGRRIDLESMSRCTPFWRTDFPAGPTVKQCHTYGLSFWAPLNATGNVNPMKVDAYSLRSTWSSSMAFELYGVGDTPQAKTDMGEKELQKAKAALQEYRDVREYFLGDYYALTEYSQAEDAWMAWQFHREDLGQGIIQVFRRPKSICETGKLILQGLDPKAVYAVENLDTHETQDSTGEDLAGKGLSVALPERPSSAVFVYRRK